MLFSCLYRRYKLLIFLFEHTTEVGEKTSNETDSGFYQ